MGEAARSIVVPEAETLGEAYPPTRFNRMTIAELENLPEPEWIIHNWVAQGEVGVTFGDSGAGKTFATIAKACALASGADFFGSRVKKTRVLYCAGEGARRIRRRIQAYMQERPEQAADIREHLTVLPASFSLLEESDIAKLGDYLTGDPDDVPGYVIFDTLARFSVGANISDNEEMMIVHNNCMALAERLGDAGIELIHHTGHGETGRMWGAKTLINNMDFVIEMKRKDGGVGEINFKKLKDSEKGSKLKYELEQVTLEGEFDEYGCPRTSCVSIQSDRQVTGSPGDDLSAVDKAICRWVAGPGCGGWHSGSEIARAIDRRSSSVNDRLPGLKIKGLMDKSDNGKWRATDALFMTDRLD